MFSEGKARRAPNKKRGTPNKTQFCVDMESSMTSIQLLTKEETDNVIQAFGMRLIDWKRLTDQEAGEHVTDLVNRIGFDAFENALRRTRELSPKPKLLQLAGICSLSIAGIPNYVKEPPSWDADELWRNVFKAMLIDDMQKVRDATAKKLIEQATTEQAAQ